MEIDNEHEETTTSRGAGESEASSENLVSIEQHEAPASINDSEKDGVVIKEKHLSSTDEFPVFSGLRHLASAEENEPGFEGNVIGTTFSSTSGLSVEETKGFVLEEKVVIEENASPVLFEGSAANSILGCKFVAGEE